MLIFKIPFNHKNNKGNLPIDVVVMGGTHPYRDYKITEKAKIKNWNSEDCFCAPEWAEDVYFVLGPNIIRYKCEGKDFFYGSDDRIQRMHHRPNNIRQVSLDSMARSLVLKKLQ